MRRHDQAVLQRAAHFRRNILDERAARGDVQHLHAAADREDGQIARARRHDEGNLELVARRIDLFQLLMGRLAVSRGLDVAPTREQETSDARQRVPNAHRRIDDPDLTTGVKNRLPVIFELPAG